MFIYAGPFESCPSSVISAASSRKLSAGTGSQDLTLPVQSSFGFADLIQGFCCLYCSSSST